MLAMSTESGMVQYGAIKPCQVVAETFWRKAFRGIWERFAYRRMPEVADFRRVIEADLTERQGRFERLEAIQLKLETIELKKAWDEEARRRQRSGA